MNRAALEKKVMAGLHEVRDIITGKSRATVSVSEQIVTAGGIDLVSKVVVVNLTAARPEVVEALETFIEFVKFIEKPNIEESPQENLN